MQNILSPYLIFIVIFIINIIGAVQLNQMRGSTVLNIIVLASISFLLGSVFAFYYSNYFNRNKYRLVTKISFNTQFLIIFIIFIFSFLFGLSLFIEKGIPLLNQGDNALRAGLGLGSFGRIRAICTWMPLSSVILLFITHGRKLKYRIYAYISVALTILFLVFYSFKGNLLWYMLLIYSMYHFNQKGSLLRFIGLFTIGSLLGLTVFFLWLPGDYAYFTVVQIFIKRIVIDQIEGLDFIYSFYVPIFGSMHGSLFVNELNSFLSFLSLKPTTVSPDMLLAEAFYGKSVDWGIIYTLIGSLYIDFGKYGVAFGFFIIGFLTIYVISSCTSENRIEVLAIKSFLITVLLKIILVGNYFNEVRGYVFSLILFYLIYICLCLLVTGHLTYRKSSSESYK